MTNKFLHRIHAAALTLNARTTTASFRQCNRLIQTIKSEVRAAPAVDWHLTAVAHFRRRDKSEPFVDCSTFIGRMKHERVDPLFPSPVDDPLY